MAKANLNNSLDDLYDFLFPKNAKAGADNLLRKELDKEVHIFSVHKETVKNQLLQHQEALGGEGKTKDERKKLPKYSPFGSNDAGILEEFAGDLILDLADRVKSGTYAKAEVETIIHPSTNSGKLLKIKVSGSAKPYNTLSTLRSEVGGKLMKAPKYKKLFAKSYQSAGYLMAIGHDVGVVSAKGSAIVNELEDHQGIIIGEIDVAKDAIDLIKKFDLKYNLQLEHYRDVKVEGGKLTKNVEVHSNLEGHFYNSVVKANREGDLGFSEKEIAKKIQTVLKGIRKRINKHFASLGADEFAKVETSQSMLDDMKAMILFSPKIKKVTKNKKIVKKLPTKIKEPKNFSDKSKPRERKMTTVSKQDKNYSAMPARKSPAKERATTESGDSLAPLMAILNSKLPQTVARNMGPPGLENQTGRFASSVRVTDVSRTAQGFPSVGYDYRRNPYQVFETGSGRAPWATPDRDPRKLIDASIREIAAQFAIGRFYTRRI